MPSVRTDVAPQHAATNILGAAASYCTMENVQSLCARQLNEPMCVPIIISSVGDAPGGNNAYIFTAEKMAPVTSAEVAIFRRS